MCLLWFKSEEDMTRTTSASASSLGKPCGRDLNSDCLVVTLRGFK